MQRKLAIVLAAVLAVAFGAWFLRGKEPRGDDRVEPKPSRAAERSAPPKLAEVPAVASEGAGRGEAESTEATASDAAAVDSAPAKFVVRVVDRGDVPVEGAGVRWMGNPPGEPVRSDAAGESAIEVPPDATYLPLRVDAEGYAHVNAHFQHVEGLTIRLHRAVTLVGRVLDAETSEPLPGASLHRGHGSCRGCKPQPVEAGEDGRYELGDVPVGRGSVVFVRAEGYPIEAIAFELDRVEGDRYEHDFRLARGTRIRGEVVDFDTGAPVARAMLRERSGSGMNVFRSDEGGRFDFRLPRDPYGGIALDVSATGYCGLGFEVPEDADEPIRVRLPRAARIEGVVRDTDGNPVAGASVAVWGNLQPRIIERARGELDDFAAFAELPEGWDYEDEYVPTPATTTDAEGRFRSTGLIPHTLGYAVHASHPDAGTAEVEAPRLGAPGETTWVNVALAPEIPGGTIRGRMLLNGEPTAGRIAWKGPTDGDSLEVGPSGAFLFEHVEPGTIQLTASPGALRYAFTLMDGRVVELEVESGQELEHDVDVELPMAEISGRVTYADGRPAANVFVRAGSREKWVQLGGNADADGNYAIAVPDLDFLYYVHVFHGPEGAQRDGIAAGTSGVDFVLPAFGRLAYRVRDSATGEPIANLELFWRRANDTGWKSAQSGRYHDADPKGWRRVELPVGHIDLQPRAVKYGYRVKIIPAVYVAEGEDEGNRVEIELDPGVELSFKLAKGLARPEGHTVLLLEDDAWDGVRHWRSESGGNHWDGGAHYPLLTMQERRLDFDEEGVARLKGLSPGPHRFKVFPDDVAILPERVLVEEHPTEPIELRWENK